MNADHVAWELLIMTSIIVDYYTGLLCQGGYVYGSFGLFVCL